MSFSGGQLFGAVIGAAVGFFFPPAGLLAAGWATGSIVSLGFSVGMTIGGIIDPPEGQTITQTGPRLGDLSTQTSEWGSPIRRLYGTYKLSGNVIWDLDLHETKHVEESGEGKGGGGTKTETIWYSYAGSWAVGLCEGEASSIKKIWFDSVLVYDGTNYSGGLTIDNHEIYLGTATQSVDWLIEAHNPDTPAYRHLVYIVFNKIQLENYGNRIPKVSCEVEKGTDTLSTITGSLLSRAGLDVSEFDVSQGSAVPVHGYVIPNPMTTRIAITSLTSAYQFELIESGFELKLKIRNPVPVAPPITDVVDSLETTRFQSTELSNQVNIAYANVDNNYEAEVQSAKRIDSESSSVKTYQFALAFSENEAKRLAEMFLFSEWTERVTFRFSLPPSYMFLEPSDIIEVYDLSGVLFKVRLTKIHFMNTGQLVCEASAYNESVYQSNAIGSSTSTAISSVMIQGDTTIELLDIPMLDNAYNSEGIYIAAEGEFPAWKGCGVDKSTDNEVTYNSIGQITNSSIIGETTTILPSGPTTVYDLTSSVTVDVNYPLYDSTWEDLLKSENYILIGDEILQYRDALDNGNGTYTLSNLLRGRRGTEWAIGTHSIGERFVFLSNSMMFDSTALSSVDSYYRGTTFGDFAEDSVSQLITPEIRCLKPLSPSYIKGVRDGSNNLIITWMRRSRDVTGYFRQLQLFEQTEEYEIEIVNADSPTFYTSTSESFSYTNAQQLSDRASHTSGDPVEIIIYQISDVVSRGYGTQEII